MNLKTRKFKLQGNPDRFVDCRGKFKPPLFVQTATNVGRRVAEYSQNIFSILMRQNER